MDSNLSKLKRVIVYCYIDCSYVNCSYVRCVSCANMSSRKELTEFIKEGKETRSALKKELASVQSKLEDVLTPNGNIIGRWGTDDLSEDRKKAFEMLVRKRSLKSQIRQVSEAINRADEDLRELASAKDAPFGYTPEWYVSEEILADDNEGAVSAKNIVTGKRKRTYVSTYVYTHVEIDEEVPATKKARVADE